MPLARLQFGDEKLSLGKELNSDNYFLSLTRDVPDGKEFAFYITNPDLNKLRMEFENKAKELMALKPTEDLTVKIK